MNISLDFGWRSVNHYGEEVCGDRVTFKREKDRILAVLADGMGSGVKANILSTMGSTILSTMLGGGESMESAVETLIRSLPVCSERGLNYCTFSVVDIDAQGIAHLAEFDNPQAWILRNGQILLQERDFHPVEDKAIWQRELPLVEGDMIVISSDGAVNAGAGNVFSFGWTWDSVAKWLEQRCSSFTSARRLAEDMVEAVVNIYGGKPDDDVTVMALRVMPDSPVNIMYGPPEYEDDDEFMVREFMEADGMKIVCGGTTSNVVSRVLDTPVVTMSETAGDGIPPISFMDQIDLVTEGALTMTRTAEILEDYYAGKKGPKVLDADNGAAILAKILAETATTVQFFIGRASNSAYDGKNSKLNLDVKLSAAERICRQLEAQGIQVSKYYY